MIADVVFRNAYGTEVILTLYNLNNIDNWEFVKSTIDNQSYAIHIFNGNQGMQCDIHFAYDDDSLDIDKRFAPEYFRCDGRISEDTDSPSYLE